MKEKGRKKEKEKEREREGEGGGQETVSFVVGWVSYRAPKVPTEYQHKRRRDKPIPESLIHPCACTSGLEFPDLLLGQVSSPRDLDKTSIKY